MAGSKDISGVYRDIANKVENVVGKMSWGSTVSIDIGQRQRAAILRQCPRRPHNQEIATAINNVLDGPTVEQVDTVWSLKGHLTSLRLTVLVRYDV